MEGRIPPRAARLLGAVLAASATLGLTAASASAESEAVYSNLPASPPGNVVSQAFEATQLSQFGGEIELAGTARRNGAVTIGMSSWACQTGSWPGTPECHTSMGAKFAWPITLSIYEVGALNSVGALVKSYTKTFQMPYRPSQNNRKCKNEKGEPSGGWYDGALKQCFHGRYFQITFPTPALKWPTKAIISVSYNTSDYGTEPQRPKAPACETESAGCFYDSLNVGLTEPENELVPTPVAPSVGTDPQPENAYQNSQTAANYCDKGVGGTGVFRLDAGCWTGYQPLLRVRAVN